MDDRLMLTLNIGVWGWLKVCRIKAKQERAQIVGETQRARIVNVDYLA